MKQNSGGCVHVTLNVRWIIAVVILVIVGLVAWQVYSARMLETLPPAEESSAPGRAPEPEPAVEPVARTPDDLPFQRAATAPPETPVVPEPAARPSGLTIAGIVLGPDDTPVPGATVAAYHADKGAKRGASLNDGTFVIDGLTPGSYRVSAKAEGLNEAVQEEVEAGTQRLTVRMTPLSRVSGRVVQRDTGAPLPTFQIVYMPLPPGDDAHWGRIARDPSTAWRTFHDSAGRFELEGIASDSEFAVGARADGSEPAYAVVSAIAPGETAEGVEISLALAASVTGRVLAPEGIPVPGASVHLGPDTKRHALATTNAEGAFALSGLGEGEIVLSAAHPDYLPGSASVQLVRGQTVQADIVLGGGGGVEGTVRVDGAPAEGQLIVVSSIPPTGNRKQARTDAQGYYSVYGVPAGAIEVMAEFQVPGAVDAAPQRLQRQAVVADERMTAVDFDFTSMLSTLSGRITVSGEPPASAAVKGTIANPAGDAFFHADADAGGHYSAGGLRPGDAWVEVAAVSPHGGELRKNFPLTIGEGEHIRQDIDFDAATAVAGTVSEWRDGDAGEVFLVPGTPEIDLGNPRQLLELERIVAGRSEIAEGGSFRIEGVEPGAYTLIALCFSPEDDSADLLDVRFASAVVQVTASRETAVNVSF